MYGLCKADAGDGVIHGVSCNAFFCIDLRRVTVGDARQVVKTAVAAQWEECGQGAIMAVDSPMVATRWAKAIAFFLKVAWALAHAVLGFSLSSRGLKPTLLKQCSKRRDACPLGFDGLTAGAVCSWTGESERADAV